MYITLDIHAKVTKMIDEDEKEVYKKYLEKDKSQIKKLLKKGAEDLISEAFEEAQVNRIDVIPMLVDDDGKIISLED